jgi:hypothetical protein
VTFGVHDGKKSIDTNGAANESVKIEDVYDFVRTHIELLHYVGHGPPKEQEAPTAAPAVLTPASPPSDSKTAYANKFMGELERRNAANQVITAFVTAVSAQFASAAVRS